MRNLGLSAANVGTLLGTEPINVIGIRWTPNGSMSYYADKDIPGAAGTILSIGQVSNVIDDNWTQTVSDVAVQLSDPTGELRSLFDEQDVHKVPAVIYQTYADLGLSGIFEITPNGQITTPISYDETSRTISFNISTQVELPEAGFSSESASISRANKDDYKNWPMCFGDVVYVPAAELDTNPTGRLRTAFGNADPLLQLKIDIFANRNQLLTAQYAALVAYDSAVLNLVSPAIQVLQDYIVEIGRQDSILRQITPILERIDRINEAIKKANGDPDRIKDMERLKKQLTDRLDDLGRGINLIIARKETVRDAISGIQYEQQTHSQIFQNMNEIIDQIYENNAELGKLYKTLESQLATMRNSIVIENGHTFPQGEEVSILIKDVKYTGVFDKDVFEITAGPLAKYDRLEVEEGEADRFTLHSDHEAVNLTSMFCLVYADSPNDDGDLTPGYHILRIESQQGLVCKFTQVERRLPDPPETPQYTSGTGISRWAISGFSDTLLTQQNAFPIDDEERRNIITLEDLHAKELLIDIPSTIRVESPVSKYIVDGENIHYIKAASPVILADWLNMVSTEELQAINAEGLVYHETASPVQLHEPTEIYYIANIIESDVVAVHAYKNTPLGQILFRLPSRFYTVHDAVDLNGLTVTAISLKQKLSAYVGLDWADDLYITLRSSVGPRTPDIIEWLLDTYTDYTFTDLTGVNWDNYPMHFARFGRENTLELVKSLAYQARCGLYIKGTEISLIYLSSEGSSVDTINTTDLYMESLKLEVGDTEILATKILAEWRPDYLPDSQRTMVLRHNINKYGTVEKQIDFFAYTDRDLVEKSATFWLIRNANSWKQLSFSTPLTKLALEPFDTITLNIETTAESVSCTAQVIQADYNTESNQIDFKVWLPVKLGTVDVYDLAYPSDVDGAVEFPTQQEIYAGYAGSGLTVEGTIGTIVSGAPYSDNRPLDWGKKFLSDSVDGEPESPIDSGNLFAVEDDIPPEPQNESFYLPPYPEIDTYSTAREQRPVFPLRDAYMGWIVDGGGYNYNVMLHTGQLVPVGCVSADMTAGVLEPGTPVYVITGNRPNEFLMYAKPQIHYTQQVKVRRILDDFLVCEDSVGNDVIVARPLTQWKTSYHNVTSNGWTYKNANTTERYSTRVGESGSQNTIIEYLFNYYNAGDRIVIGYLPYGLTSPINGTTNWIDLNVDGIDWKPFPVIPVTIFETTNRNPIVCRTTAQNYTIQGTLLNKHPNYVVYKNAQAFAVLDQRSRTYALIELKNQAPVIIGKLSQHLGINDSTGKANPHKWFDGIPPKDNEISFQSPYLLEADKGDYVRLEMNDEGTYIAVGIIPSKRERIKFTLTANLTADNTATAATNDEGEAVNVYSELGFEGVIGGEGYAEYDFKNHRYRIYQMVC